MLTLDMMLQIGRIDIFHWEATMVTSASNLLHAILGEGVARELVVDARSVSLPLPGLLGGGLLVTDIRVRLGRSLGGTGAAGGLTVPHDEPGQKRRGGGN